MSRKQSEKNHLKRIIPRSTTAILGYCFKSNDTSRAPNVATIDCFPTYAPGIQAIHREGQTTSRYPKYRRR